MVLVLLYIQFLFSVATMEDAKVSITDESDNKCSLCSTSKVPVSTEKIAPLEHAYKEEKAEAALTHIPMTEIGLENHSLSMQDMEEAIAQVHPPIAGIGQAEYASEAQNGKEANSQKHADIMETTSLPSTSGLQNREDKILEPGSSIVPLKSFLHLFSNTPNAVECAKTNVKNIRDVIFLSKIVVETFSAIRDNPNKDAIMLISFIAFSACHRTDFFHAISFLAVSEVITEGFSNFIAPREFEPKSDNYPGVGLLHITGKNNFLKLNHQFASRDLYSSVPELFKGIWDKSSSIDELCSQVRYFVNYIYTENLCEDMKKITTALNGLYAFDSKTKNKWKRHITYMARSINNSYVHLIRAFSTLEVCSTVNTYPYPWIFIGDVMKKKFDRNAESIVFKS